MFVSTLRSTLLVLPILDAEAKLFPPLMKAPVAEVVSTVRAPLDRTSPDPVRSVKASVLKVKVSPASTVRPPLRVVRAGDGEG